MSLLENCTILNKSIKNVLEKEYLGDKEKLKETKEFNDLITQIFEIAFQCFTNKNLLKKIENNYPEHFQIANKTVAQDPNWKEGDVWIFGYGSLIWKVDFPYETCHRGYICGYERRFFQNSLDHRGVPERPGRVVTCIPSTENSRVYGMAYKIPTKLKTEVLEHLDYREKNGYERCILNFFHYPDSSKENFKVIMYIATAENESYAGHIAEIKDIAEQIYWSWGPSGSNREYVYNLSISMRYLFPDVNDTHLTNLEKELLRKESFDTKIANEILRQLHNKTYEIIRNNVNEKNLVSQINEMISELRKEVYHMKEFE